MSSSYTLNFLNYCEELATKAGKEKEFLQKYVALRETYGIEDACKMALAYCGLELP